MKFQLKNIIAILVIAFAFASCSNTEDTTTVNELDGITKFKEIVNATHTIELYTHMGYLEQGFNEVSLRIKDNATGEYVKTCQ